MLSSVPHADIVAQHDVEEGDYYLGSQNGIMPQKRSAGIEDEPTSSPKPTAEEAGDIFDAFDTDHDGTLTMAELLVLVRSFRQVKSEEELLAHWDTDENGQVGTMQ